MSLIFYLALGIIKYIWAELGKGLLAKGIFLRHMDMMKYGAGRIGKPELYIRINPIITGGEYTIAIFLVRP